MIRINGLLEICIFFIDTIRTEYFNSITQIFHQREVSVPTGDI